MSYPNIGGSIGETLGLSVFKPLFVTADITKFLIC